MLCFVFLKATCDQHRPPQYLDGIATHDRSGACVAHCTHAAFKLLTSLKRFPRMYRDCPHIRGHLPIGILSTE